MKPKVDVDVRAVERLEEGVAAGLAHVGARLAHDVRSRAPADTGRYRESITSEVEGGSARVLTHDPLGHLLELGTVRMRARPHFTPAAGGVSEAEVADDFRQGMNEAGVR